MVLHLPEARRVHPDLERTSPGPADLAGDRRSPDPRTTEGGNLMFGSISEEVWKQLAQAHQGPRKPPARWKRMLAGSLRGLVYVAASPVTLFVGVIALLIWAFEMSED
jgi:hypothetical protein